MVIIKLGRKVGCPPLCRFCAVLLMEKKIGASPNSLSEIKDGCCRIFCDIHCTVMQCFQTLGSGTHLGRLMCIWCHRLIMYRYVMMRF